MKSFENENLNYLQCVSIIKENIRYIIYLLNLNNSDKIKFKIYHHSFIIKNDMVSEFQKEGLDIRYDDYKFNEFTIKNVFDNSFYRSDLNDLYLDTINDELIKSYLVL